MAGSNGYKPSYTTEGEHPSSASHQEAKRWVSVYAELLAMETTVIGSVRAALCDMSSDARRITEMTNLPQMENDVEHFRTRLALWRDRLAQLEG